MQKDAWWSFGSVHDKDKLTGHYLFCLSGADRQNDFFKHVCCNCMGGAEGFFQVQAEILSNGFQHQLVLSSCWMEFTILYFQDWALLVNVRWYAFQNPVTVPSRKQSLNAVKNMARCYSSRNLEQYSVRRAFQCLEQCCRKICMDLKRNIWSEDSSSGFLQARHCVLQMQGTIKHSCTIAAPIEVLLFSIIWNIINEENLERPHQLFKVNRSDLGAVIVDKVILEIDRSPFWEFSNIKSIDSEMQLQHYKDENQVLAGDLRPRRDRYFDVRESSVEFGNERFQAFR